MPISNYSSGFAAGVLIRNRLILQAENRRVLYVGNNSTLLVGEKGESNNNNAGGFLSPYETVDFAIGRAKEGDLILVRPNYTETMLVAGQWAADVAGITILGQGTGASRPTLTFDTTLGDGTASVLITEDSIAIGNIIGLANEDNLDNPFNVQAADCTLDILWKDGSSTLKATSVIVADASADRLTIALEYDGFIAGSGCTNPIKLDGLTGAEIDVNFYGECGTAVVNFVSNAVDDVNVRGTFYVNGTTDASKNVIDTVTSSTWSATGFDANAGARFSGGSTINGLDIDDVSVIASDVIVMDAVVDQIYSDSGNIRGDVTEILSDLETIASDLVLVDAVVDQIYSDSGNIRTDVTEILSDLETLKSDLVLVDTVVDQIYSDTGNIRTDVTEILSDLETIASDLVLVDTVVDQIYSDTGNIRADVTEILSDLETIASDLILVDTVVDTLTTNLISNLAVGKFVSDTNTGNSSDSLVIGTSDTGVLTGISQVLMTIEPTVATLTVRIDSVQLLSTTGFVFNPHSAAVPGSDVVINSMNFNHPFAASLYINHQKDVASGSLTTFVAYTTD